ncbi:MAG: hypothetical protein GY765_17465, partial [bacterium]|nr:hypothetical protein [bacterium]
RFFADAIWEVEPDAKLIAPLPFEKKEYEGTFFHRESIDEFNRYLQHPQCIEHYVIDEVESENFLPIGKYVVDHSDVMFFISDEASGGTYKMDGGTYSVQSYADFQLQELTPPDTHRIPLPFKTTCTINTTEATSTLALATHIPDSKKEKQEIAFYTNNCAIHLKDFDCGFDSCSTPMEFKDKLAEFAEKYFDTPSSKYQGQFSRQSLFVVCAAFAISLLVLFDWASGGNDFFNGLGVFKKIFNWDSMVVMGFLSIILFVLFFNKRSHLQKWVENRYLSERLRQAFLLLYAGIPFSTIMNVHKNDPSHQDLNKAWMSLYFHLEQEYKKRFKTQPTTVQIKEHILEIGTAGEEHGLLFGQFDWYKRKSAVKYEIQKKFDRMKNCFFFLTILTSATAAATVIFNVETAQMGTRFDVLSSILSLMLAATAALSQVKEHGKIANQYIYTCKQLSEIYRRIYFCTGNDETTRLKHLRQLVVESSEQLMKTTYSWMYTQQGKDPDWA